MGAEKVISLNPEKETELLKERISLLESVIDYSVAETVKELKDKVKNLEAETIQLRATDAEKDKLIAEKEQRIQDMKNSFNNTLEYRLSEQRRQFEAEKKQSLSDQRKNINAKIVKPKEELLEQSKKEVNRIQDMYNSLLGEFKQVNDKLDTHTTLLYQIIDIVSNSSSIEEANEEIEEIIAENKTALGIKYVDSRKPSKADQIAFTNLVNQLSELGKTNKEIAQQLYKEKHPFMVLVATENAREQKVGRYLKKKY